MTAKIDALRALKAAVESGRISTDLITEAFGDLWEDIRVLAAFDGSLDAAKALHDAVLPEWPLKILFETHADGVYCCLLAPISEDAPKWTFAAKYEAKSVDPARAWLLAILAALIAQEEER